MEERSDIPQRLWETEALGADVRRDIFQYPRVRGPAWTLLLGRDLKSWALTGRDTESLSKSKWHLRGASW